MHRWGDEDIDWDALRQCQNILYRWARLGRITGQIKEKYGTLRWYAHVGSWWQRRCYNWAYQACLNKYPHIRAEILCNADHPELIKGACRREGKDLHILGWNGETVCTWEGL